MSSAYSNTQHKFHGNDRRDDKYRGGQRTFDMKCDFWDKKDYDLSLVIADQAEKLAEDIGSISRNQLRNFYGEVKSLERRLEVQGEKDWKNILPLIKMLKAKVKYASAKASSVQNVPESFAQFIEKSVNKINTTKEFKEFCLIFEAVVGYIYGMGGAKK